MNKPMDERHWDSLDRKVEHLDIQYSTLSSRMSGIETSIKGLTDAVGKLTDKANQPQKTEWQAILAGLALVFTLAASYSNLSTAPIIEDLNRLDESQTTSHSKINEILLDHTKSIGKIEAIINGGSGSTGGNQEGRGPVP
jgi:hypothetical protein